MMLMLWVAPQSDITHPLNPIRSFKSRWSVSGFSQLHFSTPDASWRILLYEHMTEPTSASIAPWYGE